MRSDYEVIQDTAEFLLIKDMDRGNRSVTNDAENVVTDLCDRLRGRKLYYIDTMGQIDEILIRDGEFDGFLPGGPK